MLVSVYLDGERRMSHWWRTALALLVAATTSGCRDASAPPPPNVRVTTSPKLAASFASLGGVHTFLASVTDTLGGPRSDPVTWTVIPASAAVAVDGGTVTIAPTVAAGEYRVVATAAGVSDTSLVRVLPRPPGKLVFTSAAGTTNQVFVKDFASNGDAVQITSGASASGGLAVDQATGTIVVSRGTLPNVDLFRMNDDGSDMVNLTNNATASNQGPSFNRVTGEIYFSRRGLSGTVTQIFRMAPDGTGLAEVASGTQGKVQPAVSPDGLLLSWTEIFPGFNQEIVTSSITGSNAIRFTDRAGIDCSSFWISNSRLAWGGGCTTDPDVFVADVPAAGAAVNLTNGDGRSSQPSGGCSPGTITIVRTAGLESAAYQLDVNSGLAVKYTLPVPRTVLFARRLC